MSGPRPTRRASANLPEDHSQLDLTAADQGRHGLIYGFARLPALGSHPVLLRRAAPRGAWEILGHRSSGPSCSACSCSPSGATSGGSGRCCADAVCSSGSPLPACSSPSTGSSTSRRSSAGEPARGPWGTSSTQSSRSPSGCWCWASDCAPMQWLAVAIAALAAAFLTIVGGPGPGHGVDPRGHVRAVRADQEAGGRRPAGPARPDRGDCGARPARPRARRRFGRCGHQHLHRPTARATSSCCC